jgi:molybdopterin-guanine dinucleotide biosynthesis protein A
MRSQDLDGIILAGGQSRRMGVSKCLLPWGETTLLAHMVALLGSWTRRVLVIGYDGTAQEAGIGATPIIAEAEKVGPLGGLYLGLEAAQTTHCLVTACDMPFINPEVVPALLNLADTHDVVIPQAADGLHPLLGIYSRACLGPIRECLNKGERRPVSFFPTVRVALLPVPPADLAWSRALLNINAPADFDAARRLV